MNNSTVKLIHISGLKGVAKTPVTLELDELNRKILIHANPKYCNGESEFAIELDKITAAGKDFDVKYKKTSGMGKAIAGGMMFGAAGAIIGAATNKDKKVTNIYDVIRYKENNVPKFLTFKSYFSIKKEKLFIKRVNELINSRNANPDGSIDL